MSKNWSDAKVLVVEDNALSHMVIRKALDTAGIQVNNPTNYTLAKDGQPALDLFTGENEPMPEYDLIICDRNMPKMNGEVFIQAIRDKGYKGFILANSGDEIGIAASGKGAEDLLLGAGADVFCVKSEIVTGKINTVLNKVAGMMAEKNPQAPRFTELPPSAPLTEGKWKNNASYIAEHHVEAAMPTVVSAAISEPIPAAQTEARPGFLNKILTDGTGQVIANVIAEHDVIVGQTYEEALAEKAKKLNISGQVSYPN